MLAGCISSIKGAPDRLISVEQELSVARAVSGHDAYIAYATSFGAQKRELRNQIILARLYAIDVSYTAFEADLTSERQKVDFFSTVTGIGLTSTAAAVASIEAKTALATAATALLGVRESYDKDILFEKTTSLLQQQMRSARKIIKSQIIERLGADTATYPLELALPDVENYYRAGTITGALLGLTEDGGVKLRNATVLEQETITARFGVSRYTELIRAFWKESGTNRVLTENWVAANVGVPPSLFINSGSYSAQHQRFYEEVIAGRARFRTPARDSNMTGRRSTPSRVTARNGNAHAERRDRGDTTGDNDRFAETDEARRIRHYMSGTPEKAKEIRDWVSSNFGLVLSEVLNKKRYLDKQNDIIVKFKIP